MGNRFLTFAALSGFFAVAFGAFVAHSLESHLNANQLLWFEKAWRYQVFHTLALLILGLFLVATEQQTIPACRKRAVNIIGFSWVIGILGFSGGLYAMVLLNSTSFVMIVPTGGIAFLVGWATLFYVSVRNNLKK